MNKDIVDNIVSSNIYTIREKIIKLETIRDVYTITENQSISDINYLDAELIKLKREYDATGFNKYDIEKLLKKIETSIDNASGHFKMWTLLQVFVTTVLFIITIINII